jgi:hypothetical protein
VDAAAFDASLAAILRDARDDWRVTSRAIEALDAGKRWAPARAIAQDWLARHRKDKTLDVVDAQTAVARELMREGRIPDALAAVQPHTT